jgi:hypothetical protein
VTNRKRCRTCGVVKGRGEFYWHEKYRTVDKLTVDCKLCLSARAREYRQLHPERVAAIQRRSAAKRRACRPVQPQRPIVALSCAECGSLFEQSVRCFTEQRFCGAACRGRAFEKRDAARRRSLRESRPPSVCIECSARFVGRRLGGKYCSDKCRWAADRRRNPGKRRESWRLSSQRRRLAGKSSPSRYPGRRELDPLRLEAKRAWLRAYAREHKAEFAARKRERLKIPEFRDKKRERDFRRKIRDLPDSERELRAVLREFKRWCRSNGYGGYRQFFEAANAL